MDNATLYSAYFKSDSDYYLTRLQQYREGRKMSFNGYAFFFGVLWFMYRKMYVEAFIILFLIIVEGVIEEVLLESAGVPGSSGVNVISTIVIASILGVIGNSLYMKKAQRVVAKAKEENTDEQSMLQYLQEKGGTSYSFVLLIVVVIAAVVAYFYSLNN
ncbi:DUF2628 domain-containing protein [Aridibaculum aurantiacum]|uniref:DUF2628 domain-containing protein n=1 Tax=Aridibaculum aurantiacum TaxID=2810307 RepID=UPI001A973F4A|nr:DUF2628 domain-containing protein [Aridibaculum aurantiacum]